MKSRIRAHSFWLASASAALVAAASAPRSEAQPAYRVEDIRPLSGHGSAPRDFMRVGDAVFFAAQDEASGTELWRTDGTPAGTRLVKDVVPGPDHADPRELTGFADRLFFTTSVGELWRSDGTEHGTVLFDAGFLSASGLTVHDGWLYFAARDPAHGVELWRTDGTPDGTALVKDIQPGPDGSVPQHLVSAGGHVYFSAIGPGGQELWRSDGTEGGTLLVSDIAPGGWSSPEDLTAVGPSLFFTADDGTHGREPWVTSLATGATALVRDVASGVESSFPFQFVSMGGLAYFVADDGPSGGELWRSDGTTAGTFRVRDINPGLSGSLPSWLTVVGHRLFFSATTGGAPLLWSSDGTAAGTSLASTQARVPFSLTAFDGALFFSAEDDAHGRELWTSDGTVAGTLVRDLRPGPESATPADLASIGGRLYFSAVRPGALTAPSLGDPWTSDGTTAGSALLKAIGSSGGAGIEAGVAWNGAFYFGADDGVHGTELWRSDGTEAGTILIKDLVAGADPGFPSQFAAAGGFLYFRAWADSRVVLWRTDGTPAGTVRVTSPGHPLREVAQLRGAGATLFFRGRDEEHGSELWTTDGTEAGTVLVRDIEPGEEHSFPDELTLVNGTLFFSAYEWTLGRELWKSDGTAAGTVRVEDINTGHLSSSPRRLAAAGGLLYFSAEDGTHGSEPWRSDGTVVGTLPIGDLRPAHRDRRPWSSWSKGPARSSSPTMARAGSSSGEPTA